MALRRTAISFAEQMKKYIGSIDQGTTSTRFILFDYDGTPVASSQAEHKQIFPKAAWVEHDPEEIWDRTEQVIRETLEKSSVSVSDIAAVGITNQRETVLFWDRVSGKCYYNAIVWQDQRGAPLCERISSQKGSVDYTRAKAGAPLIPYFSASKIHWLLENVDGLREAAERGDALCGTVDSFLIWRLTGGAVHATDVTNASRTLLYNIHSLRWDPELLDLFSVPVRCLPEVRASSGGFGRCVGVLEGVPLAGVLGDQQAALFGQTCFSPGDSKITYGTGCFVLMNTGTRPVASEEGLLSTVAYQLEGEAPVYALEGSVAVAGSLISWLRDNLGLIRSAEETGQMFASVPDSGGVSFVPAFNGLFAPFWRSDARGVIVGLTGFSNRNHIVRAALEAVAFQSLDLIHAMDKDVGAQTSSSPVDVQGIGNDSSKHLYVDGGMTANDELMQFQADISGLTVVRPKVAETTALGAAYVAGLAVGYWKNIDDVKQHWALDKQWTPTMSPEITKAKHETWLRAVEKTHNLA